MSRRTESKRAERWQKTGRRDKQIESDVAAILSAAIDRTPAIAFDRYLGVAVRGRN